MPGALWRRRAEDMIWALANAQDKEELIKLYPLFIEIVNDALRKSLSEDEIVLSAYLRHVYCCQCRCLAGWPAKISGFAQQGGIDVRILEDGSAQVSRYR
jgi:hypothetical protein